MLTSPCVAVLRCCTGPTCERARRLRRLAATPGQPAEVIVVLDALDELLSSERGESVINAIARLTR